MGAGGRCHCGDIRHEAEIALHPAMICHCSEWRILSGSAIRAVAVPDAANASVVASPVSRPQITCSSQLSRQGLESRPGVSQILPVRAPLAMSPDIAMSDFELSCGERRA